ncbi:MAG TPA: Ig-like domain repeat protein [Gemmataceae bacterium]|nr:Ig-like domain repeat protein [Gemmataceae bacterium]
MAGAGGTTISQEMWLEEDNWPVDRTVGSANATFSMRSAPGIPGPSSTGMDFRPPSFSTWLQMEINNHQFWESDTVPYKGSVLHGLSDTDTDQIWLTPGAVAAGGVLPARTIRRGSPGVAYGRLAAAPQVDAPAFASLRIYTVTSDGTSFTINGFNDSGVTLALASDDLLVPPSQGTAAAFDPNVTFSNQYDDGATGVGTISSSGNVWAARDDAGDLWLTSWAHTAKPPVLPEDGESVTFDADDLQPGGGALWLNFPTDSGEDTVSFLIVADASNTTMTLASSADTSDYGQSVTLTATVDHLAGGSGTPTGTVTFYDYDPITQSSVSLGSATLVDGQASLTTNALAVGAHTIRAAYSGDSTFNLDAAELSQTVNALEPTLSVSADGGSFTGSAFAATATVTGVLTGVDDTPAASLEGVTPTLIYYAGSSASGTPLAGAPTQAGTYTVVAAFAGSADYTAASASTTFTISKVAPTLNLSDEGGYFTGDPFAAIASLAGIVTGVDDTPGNSLEGVALILTYYSGMSASGDPLEGAPSDPGTYTVRASFAGSSDYDSAYADVTFTISPNMG